jgi:putative transposase
MHKTTYKYRIYPTKHQVSLFNQTLNECRWLYNHFLEERKYLHEEYVTSIGLYDQIKALPKMKINRPALSSVHSQVLQNVAVRVDLAFKAFYRRVKAHEKEVGYPRFKGIGWYDSFTFPQVGYSIGDNSIELSKIGKIKAIIHTPVIGKIKTCNIRRSNLDKWYVTFTAEVEDNLLPECNKAVGIDVGIKKFAMLSNGDEITNPKFFRRDEHDLARANRKHSKSKVGSKERTKRRKTLNKIHERISNRRSNFAHQESRKIVNQYGIICVEDLEINKMVHNHCIAKSISDVSWGQFLNYLSYKAENAGRKFVKVNPAYTSQTCSKCGHRQTLTLSDRVFNCPCCGLHIDRDLNSSHNILALGLDSLGIQPLEAVCFS